MIQNSAGLACLKHCHTVQSAGTCTAKKLCILHRTYCILILYNIYQSLAKKNRIVPAYFLEKTGCMGFTLRKVRMDPENLRHLQRNRSSASIISPIWSSVKDNLVLYERKAKSSSPFLMPAHNLPPGHIL